ncbi:molybdopterin-guanine dinucleotide biosynthesis protein B [Candidatus Bathyarchaeota archaeon]|nr:molybdopterin-guanine dinucleotide biosynthesis protein B [Candidatus Bathyarchaeota archaeon]NIU81683.1 molybdopterin-guanine dinucleotide biosynthesis protein B [Candidatus Bathyarchaeota archaeon]NIV68329.1 molybdopterin-guanine dinucleotide biosynthesis protein B [Candidatus Bathyarchaeota archaeon]NIW34867.1 molybdopterin-guanine dinucleotide biosynthesis protein B [Candidatus Bathyarchaeota archaeon]
MALLVCVVSRARGRGKTVLIERLTERFASERFKVVTVKHISGSFDTSKKDTWRHLEAGAALTVASTPNEIVTITRTSNPPLEETLDTIYTKPQLILVEGYKRSPYPKILCAETAEEAAVALEEITNIIMVTGRISSRVEDKKSLQRKFPESPVYDFDGVVSALKAMLVDSVLKELPGLDCKHCGYDSCRELAKAIIGGEATIEDCEVLTTEIATLKVDGTKVPLGNFPQQIIRSVVLGIIDTLKGIRRSPRHIEITVSAEDDKESSA